MAIVVDPFKAPPKPSGIVDPFKITRPTTVPQPAAPTTRTWGEFGGDMARGVAGGGLSLAGAIAELPNLATGGAVDRFLVRPAQRGLDRALGGTGEDTGGIAGGTERARAGIDAGLSPALKGRKQQQQERIAAAEGTLDKFTTGVTSTLRDPMLLGQFAAEQVPQLFAAAGLARGAKAGVAATESAKKAATAAAAAGRPAVDVAKILARPQAAAAERAMIGWAGAQGAGYAGQEAIQDALAQPDEVWDANQEFVARAAQIGREPAKQEFAMKAGQIAAAVSGPISAAAGALTAPLERAIFTGQLRRELLGTGKEGVKLLSRQGAARVGAGVAKEAGEEAIQEGGEKFAQNVGIQTAVDPTRTWGEGVPESAGIGAALGGVLGGGLVGGGLALSRPREQPFPGAPPGSLSDAGNVVAETASGPPQAQQPPTAADTAQEQPLSPEEVTAWATEHLRAIDERLNGTPDQEVIGPDGKPIKVPGKLAQFVGPEERALAEFLRTNIDNPALIAQRLDLRRPPATEGSPTAEPTPEQGDLNLRPQGQFADPLPAPWVNRETGAARAPSDQELADLMVAQRAVQQAQFGNKKWSAAAWANAWAVAPDRIKAVAAAIREGTITPTAASAQEGKSDGRGRSGQPVATGRAEDVESGRDSGPTAARAPDVLGEVPGVQPPAPDQAQPTATATEAEPTAPAVTGNIRQDLVTAGYPAESVANMTDQQAFDTLERVKAGTDESKPRAGTYTVSTGEQARVVEAATGLFTVTVPGGKPGSFRVGENGKITGLKAPAAIKAKVREAAEKFVAEQITAPAAVPGQTSQTQASAVPDVPASKTAPVPGRQDGTETAASNQVAAPTPATPESSTAATSASATPATKTSPLPEAAAPAQAAAQPEDSQADRDRAAPPQAPAPETAGPTQPPADTSTTSSDPASAQSTPKRKPGIHELTKEQDAAMAAARAAAAEKEATTTTKETTDVRQDTETTAQPGQEGTGTVQEGETRSLTDERRANQTERERIESLPPAEKDAEIARLRAEVRRDDLTGLLNQKAYRQDEAAKAFKRFMAMVDLDLFKGINDILGYDGADLVLALFGKIIAKVNPNGQNYRRGGDEFTLTADTRAELETAVRRLRNLATRVRLELTAKSGERMIVQGILHSAGIGTDADTANTALGQAKAGKPSSRDGAVPENIRRAGEQPQGPRVPETQPDRDGPSPESGRGTEVTKTPPTGGVSASGLTPAAWDAMGYGGRQTIAQASDISALRPVVHRISGSKWAELSDGERASMRAAAAKLAASTPPKKRSKAKRADKRTARELQAELFRALVNDPAMAGKSVEDIANEIHARTADAPLAPGIVSKLAAAVAKDLGARAEELRKQEHRQPSVYKAALAAAVTARFQDAGDVTEEQHTAFVAGWDHALKGKTKSTLSGEPLAVKQYGYEAARKWMKTEEGAAWYEGRPARKLENTGADLRRWYEQQRDALKSNETDGTKLWGAMSKVADRAKLFPIEPPAGSTPGVQRLMEFARSKSQTFVEYFAAEITSRDAPFRSKDGRSSPYISARKGRRRWQASPVDQSIKLIDRLLRPDSEHLFQIDHDALPTKQSFPLSGPIPTKPLTVDEAREALLDIARRYVSDMEALRGAVTGQNAAEAAANIDQLRKSNRPLYARLFPGVNSNSDPLENSRYSRVDYIVRDDATPLEAPDKAKPLTPPRLDRVERERMPDQRKGQDVTPQQFKETFGFADVGFGKWVAARQDQDHLNYAFDAFIDLANHFGIEPKLIGLGGQMHFTIGALGHGKFAAHFQPSQPHPDGGTVPVINVTNTRGDGTVYHEWAHAFDMHGAGGDWPTVRKQILNLLKHGPMSAATVNRRARDFLLGGSYWKGNKRQSKLDAALYAMGRKDVLRDRTAYYINAIKLDGGKKDPYWSNDLELFARAVEAWATDTLNGLNTYLTNPRWNGDGAVTKEGGWRGTPYPRGAERQMIGQVLDALRKSVSVVDGRLSVDGAKFEAALPDSFREGEERRAFLAQRENMEAYHRELQAEQIAAQEMKNAAAEAKAQAERDEADRLAAEKLADLAPSSPSESMGTPTDDELSALFDEAAAELRESTQEQPDAPAPGEAVADLAAAASQPPTTTPADQAATRNAHTPQTKAQDATAAALVKEAAKLGVQGIDEAMQGLVKLFGSAPGRLNAFPAGFDEKAYAAAKPHFEAALKSFQAAGKTLKDLFRFLIQNFGDGIKEYAIRFAKDQNLDVTLGQSTGTATPSERVATWVQERLARSEEMTWRDLFAQADAAWGGTQAAGAYTPKDAYDAVEMGMNRYILANPSTFNPGGSTSDALVAVQRLEALTRLLPTQTKRTAEMDEFQQFSTVPPFAFIANWVAKVTGADVMLEPSAGIGGLSVFAKNAGAGLILNELSSRRAGVLRQVFPDAAVFQENAEQLDNILPPDLVPSVVVMNPPFSATAGRMQGQRKTSVGAQHIDQALARLADGGRLVAIAGEGMALDKAAFKDWWAKTRAKYDVRAVIPVDGSGYAKYGTTFDNVLIVIDKVKPTPNREVITTPAKAYTDLVGILTEVRNGRPESSVRHDPTTQPDAAESAPGVAPSSVEGEGRTAQPPTAGPVGVGDGAPVRQPTAGPDGPGRGGTRSGRGRGAAVRQPGGTGVGDGAQSGRGGTATGDGARAPSGGSVTPDQAESGVTLEAGETKPAAELTDSIFEEYLPQKLQVPGAQPHPGALVQSSAMASVLPPDPTYTPNLPPKTVTSGQLSVAQIEAVVYAGQAHEQVLPSGERRGFFIGDGTGVGKGREIAGIILDNLRKGRKRHVWISEKQGLMTDAKRDFKGVGGDDSIIFNQNKTKAEDSLPADRDGILFTTYSTLRSGAKAQKAATETKTEGKKKAGQTRLDQLVNYLGKDFDGVLVFDEAHNAGNAVPMKGKRGVTKASEQALALVALQEALPQARVVYVSATGATNVSNLSYATRLGLWGNETPFASVKNFIAEMEAGGLETMELVARDMKQMGAYIARSLSFNGVSYSRVEHELTSLQRDMYDRMADGWQVTLQNFDKALEVTGAKPAGGGSNAKAIAAAKSAYWGAQQRFFNQIISSMQMPSVIAQMERDLAAGDALVLQLVNTNEAQQERALAKRKDEADGESIDLEDLDLTPRDMLMQMVEKSFPVVQFESYIDDEGRKASRPVVDSAGNPVLNREAVAMRDRLLKDLEEIAVPEGPLEQVLNWFGIDQVAEVTGRSRRVVNKPNDAGEVVPQIERRGAAAARADADAFMADRKRIMLFSDAGGTGFSFHADLTKPNQRKRKHYLIQPGWRADKAVQGFGRTHRTNQASAPHYYLAATDIPAHARFLSSIARRLDQLGALTKGQRDTANQGLFSEKDNLESIYATQAVRQLFQDMQSGHVPGLELDEFLRQTGLEGLIDPETATIPEEKMPPVSQFLNRMLSLNLAMQHTVFDAFITRMEEKVEVAIQRGELDTGMETIRALEAKVTSDDTIYTDPRTGAETSLIELDLTLPNTFYPFPDSKRQGGAAEWMVNKTSGRVWLRVASGTATNAKTGAVTTRYRMHGTGGSAIRSAEDFVGKVGAAPFETITEDEARARWQKENEARPAEVHRQTFLISGALLPIWDRLQTTGRMRVVRTQTTDGRRLLGRQVQPADVPDVRKRFDITSPAARMAPADVMAEILKGKVGELANGWRIKRSVVSGDLRLELLTGYLYGPAIKELTDLGVIQERIEWKERLFIPTGQAGVPVLQALFRSKPLIDLMEEKAPSGSPGSFSLAPPNESGEFRKWFGKSKVVDGKGRPLVVYHGTRAEFTTFDPFQMGMGTGGWFTRSRRYAAGYGPNVMAVNLSVQKPLDLSSINLNAKLDEYRLAEVSGLDQIKVAEIAASQSFNASARMYDVVNTADFARLAQAAGYDGIVAREGRAGQTWAVFRPEQVRALEATPARFSQQTAPASGMAPAALEVAVARITAEWKGDSLPQVTVVATAQDLPAAARTDPAYRRAEGYYDGRRIWLVAANIRGLERARQVLAHEAVGHFGVDRILGPDEWGQVVETIRAMRARRGGSESMKAVLAAVEKRYGALSDVDFAKEAVAVLAERGVRNSIMDRVVRALRRFLRQWMPDLTWSESELQQLLVRSETLLREGQPYSERVAQVRAMAFSQGAPRSRGIPPTIEAPVHRFRNDQPLKAHPRYVAAKAGDMEAAVDLVSDLAPRLVDQAKAFGPDVVFVAPHAEEATGMNAIPRTLAAYLAAESGGQADTEVVQTNRAFHTGADAMQRLLARSEFDGAIQQGKRYVLVDDVTTMGGTLADLASYIQANGGEVVGAVVLVNAARSGKLTAEGKVIRQLEERFGDEIRDQFGIDPSALTAEEAGYLIGFRSAGELRNRAVAAARARSERLRAKGIRQEDVTDQPAPPSAGPGRSEGLFSLPPAEAVATIESMLRTSSPSMLERIKGKIEDWRPQWLGALQLRHLAELGQKYLPHIGIYADLVQQISTDRNVMLEEGGEVAGRWQKWAGKNRRENSALVDLMHDATIAGTDPAGDFKPITFTYSGKQHEATPKNIRDVIKEIRVQMKGLSGEPKKPYLEEIKRIRALPKRNAKRKAAHESLSSRWVALSPEAKAFYVEVRDLYKKRRDQREQALIQRIKDLKMDDEHKRAIQNSIRAQFEASRVEDPYFPLQRFGDFWIAATTAEGDPMYVMRESYQAWQEEINDLKAAGYQIDAIGRKGDKSRALEGASGAFVSDVIQRLKKAGAPVTVQDEIYQLYLQSLPDLSQRKHAIHRKKVVGFDRDAVRAFGTNMLHESHQIARMRYSHQLQGLLEVMQEHTNDARRADLPLADVNAADALLNEMKKRHEWIMNPTDSKLTNVVSSIGFSWYLGLTPAAAMVNLSQTAITTFPALAARYGGAKAMNRLLSAFGDSLRSGGHIQRLLTREDEKRAHTVLQQMGAIDKTLAHNLAGIAEGESARFSPGWAKAMNVVSFLFHRAEVVNRETAGMAAYRLARDDGKSFDEAVRYASDIIWQTHFDYSNDNRARFMQSGIAKVLLMFRQYSLGMTWLLARTAWLSTKGATPEVRRQALRTLTGVLGMTTVFAGVLGLPMMSMVFGLLNAAAATFGDDDEPWEAETEFRNFLADMLGNDAARVLTTGPVNVATGADIASRVTLDQLWFRDADRELEGRDAYHHYLEQIAGPIGGIGKSLLSGKALFDEGHIMRGIETMLPKVLKDSIKSLRFATEGVNNLRGDPIVADLAPAEAILQTIGFAPSRVSFQYEANRATKNFERKILDRRRFLMDGFAMAVRLDDQPARTAVLAKIRAFNAANPEIPITTKGLRTSMRNRMRYSQRAEGGIVVNRRIERRALEQGAFAGNEE